MLLTIQICTFLTVTLLILAAQIWLAEVDARQARRKAINERLDREMARL
jgi:hypothetical protein